MPMAEGESFAGYTVVRLLGVGASALGPPGPRQLSFDDALASTKDWTSATDAVDAIRAKFGREAIGPASLAGPDGLRPKRQGDQQWGPDQLRDDPEPT